MWIILLDCSGSMADPFEAVGLQLEGRVRKFEAKVKLEAAKKAVLFQLSRLDEATEVTLFGFTSTVKEICAGPAGEVERFERELAGLEAHNGTDIAAALSHAVAYVTARPDITIKPAVLLISDGKSDVEQAKTAARNCVSAGLRVDMLVIDPTDEGMQMAKAIMHITKGQLERVTSDDEMLAGTGKAADRFAREAAQAEAILKRAEEEFVADREEAEARPEVSFTAGYPKIIARARQYSMQVYIHVSALLGEVEKLIREQLAQLGGALATSTADAALPIARGRLITAQPNIKNIFANPPRQEIVWMDDYHSLHFQISYAGQESGATVCGGFVDIFVDGLIVGQIPVSISVPAKRAKGPVDGAVQVETVKMLSRIFASYAHEDEALVRACKAYYRTLGIHMYVDHDELLSGDPWRATLAKLMEKSDLFQLYWSQSAADSTEVANEWQVALELSRTRPWDFIRPLYWQKPMPAAPAVLTGINFGFLDLNMLKIDLDAAISGTTMKPFEQAEQVAALFPVIALERDAPPETTEHLQEALKRVVPFLENLAGLRYYPPPTLLVDEYTITQVRSRITVDKSPNEIAEGSVDWALKVLRSLALAFHVGAAQPNKGMSDEQLKEFYGLRTEEETGDYHHVRKMCEGMFDSLIAAYLSGHDPIQDRGAKHLDDLKEHIREARKDRFVFSLDEDLGNILNAAEASDKREMERILGVSTLPRLFELQEQQPNQFSELLDRADSEEFLKIAVKYLNGFTQLFDGYPTTLQRSADFPTYLNKFFELWLRYVETAQNHRGDEIIEVGYSVPSSSLEKFESRFPHISFTRGKLRETFGGGEPEYEWSLRLSEYRRAAAALRDVILDAVRGDTEGRRKLKENFLAMVATFGVFVSARLREGDTRISELAKRNGWPGGFSLAGSHKTLLSIKALERYRQGLLESGVDEQRSKHMAQMFLTSTLVHEHFHGIAETGVDRQGRASAAWDIGGWESGSNLNEALAAWAQRHYFRDNAEMFQSVTDYINAGEYPEWPYCGAETVEKIFEEKGLPGVRSLIAQLRDDPAFAQDNFDALVELKSNG